MKSFLIKDKNVLLDEEDFDRISNIKWYLKAGKAGKFYAQTDAFRPMKNYKRVGKSVMMHRFILKLTNQKLMVDHINGNGLDNRKENLRICTNKENSRNRIGINGTSKYKGVTWDKERNRWIVFIKIDSQMKYLGRFSDEIEAAKAYDKAALKFFGKFAKPNFMGKKIW